MSAAKNLARDLPYNKWTSIPIGVPILIEDNLTGSDVPPTNLHFRFIKLTASDAYNDGVLANETVTGTAPTLEATAEISLSGSSLNGQIINLLNTEGRYLKPGNAAGTMANDQMQQITGKFTGGRGGSAEYDLGSGAFSYAGGGSSIGGTATGLRAYEFDSATSPSARTGTHTDIKHAQATAYMRIL